MFTRAFSQVHLGLSIYCYRYIINIWKSQGKVREFDEDWKVTTLYKVQLVKYWAVGLTVCGVHDGAVTTSKQQPVLKRETLL